MNPAARNSAGILLTRADQPRAWLLALASALLATALACWSISACAHGIPQVQDGHLDLSEWNWQEQGTLALDGEWYFFPGELLASDAVAAQVHAKPILIDVPAPWDILQLEDKAVSPVGVGTYALWLTLPESAPPLALGKIDISMAHRLYIDGELIHSAGTVGKTAMDSAPGFNRAYAMVPSSTVKERLLVVQVSNHQYRTGGIWESITIGVQKDVFESADASLAYSIFLASGIGVIGLYHLGLFSQRREDSSPLFFALLCLTIAVRVLSIGDRYLLQLIPGLSFNNLLRIEYISFLLAPPAFAGFLRSAMPGCYSLRILQTIAALGLLGAAFVAVTPPSVFSNWLYPFELYLVIVCLYGLAVFLRAVKAKLQVAKGFLLGFIILAASIINEVLITLGLQLAPVLLIGTGLFCFIVIQSYAISLRSAQAFKDIQVLTEELGSYSADLERKVEERTEELESANVELERLVVMDGLTKIANRRKFDETLDREWTAHRRRKAAMSVVLCDIDDFKRYNDRYGHIKGDEALRFVARAIEGCLSRPGDLAARYGGEEFVVLLPDTPGEGAIEVAERLHLAVGDLQIAHEGSRNGLLSMSLGTATLTPSGSARPSDLLQLADEALYQAKALGRDRVVTSA